MKRVVAPAILVASIWLGLPGFAAAQDQLPAQPQVQPQPQAQPQAAPAPAPDQGEGGRYTFHRTGESFLRLDTRTGQLAQCGWAATGWSCKAVPDERAALESEIARLQRENAALKRSMLSRGLDLPSGVMAEAPPVPPANIPEAKPDSPARKPTEADLDRAIAYMKDVWKKLVDMMIDLQRDIQRKS